MVKVECIGNMDKAVSSVKEQITKSCCMSSTRHYSKTFEDGNESIHFCADRHGAVSALLLPLVLEYELAS